MCRFIWDKSIHWGVITIHGVSHLTVSRTRKKHEPSHLNLMICSSCKHLVVQYPQLWLHSCLLWRVWLRWPTLYRCTWYWPAGNGKSLNTVLGTCTTDNGNLDSLEADAMREAEYAVWVPPMAYGHGAHASTHATSHHVACNMWQVIGAGVCQLADNLPQDIVLGDVPILVNNYLILEHW